MSVSALKGCHSVMTFCAIALPAIRHDAAAITVNSFRNDIAASFSLVVLRFDQDFRQNWIVCALPSNATARVAPVLAMMIAMRCAGTPDFDPPPGESASRLARSSQAASILHQAPAS